MFRKKNTAADSTHILNARKSYLLLAESKAYISAYYDVGTFTTIRTLYTPESIEDISIHVIERPGEGTFTDPDVWVWYGLSLEYRSTAISVTITNFGDVGERITGNFAAILDNGAPISGIFSVLRAR